MTIGDVQLAADDDESRRWIRPVNQSGRIEKCFLALPGCECANGDNEPRRGGPPELLPKRCRRTVRTEGVAVDPVRNHVKPFATNTERFAAATDGRRICDHRRGRPPADVHEQALEWFVDEEIADMPDDRDTRSGGSRRPDHVRLVAVGMNDDWTALADHGLELLMETGQEEDAELLQFLNDLAVRNVHINFDPANMILYGAGDPIEAVQTLGRHIRHVHIKDGTLSKQPGVIWGEEVPFGHGQVGPRRFFDALI